MVAPDNPGEKSDCNHGKSHGVIAKDRFTGKSRKQLGSHSHGRKYQDVDLRMAEKPEHMLPKKRLPASLGKEEAGTQNTVEKQHGESCGQDRQGQQQENGRDEKRPDS